MVWAGCEDVVDGFQLAVASSAMWVMGLVEFEVDVGVCVCVIGAASCGKDFLLSGPVQAGLVLTAGKTLLCS